MSSGPPSRPKEEPYTTCGFTGKTGERGYCGGTCDSCLNALAVQNDQCIGCRGKCCYCRRWNQYFYEVKV